MVKKKKLIALHKHVTSEGKSIWTVIGHAIVIKGDVQVILKHIPIDGKIHLKEKINVKRK